MKNLITLLFVCLLQTSFATTFYVSNSGNDGNNGTSEGTAWATLAKVNGRTFVAGDVIRFKGGDTFYGNIVVSNSGSSGNPITYTSYGTGKAIITGFTEITQWNNISGNIWESTNAVSTLPTMSIVIINGKSIPRGRYPNTGYLTYQSHSGLSSITSASLSGTPNWTGAEVVFRANRWAFDKGIITSQSGGTLNYTGGGFSEPTNGYGFFIQGDIRTLDNQNEWYYNAATKKLSIYSTSMPTNVSAITVDTLIQAWVKSYITIDNIDLRGANNSGIDFGASSYVTVTNCNISFIGGKSGIEIGNSSHHATVENNYITDCWRGIGGDVDGQTSYIVKYNTVRRSGLILGMQKDEDTRASSVWIGMNNSLIQYNIIDSSGYNGITIDGNNTQVRNNFINNSNLLRDDGAGIYSGGQARSFGQVIDGNIVLNSIGNPDGTNASDRPANGIYLDANTTTITVTNNSVSGTGGAGMFMGATINCIVRNNTFYDNGSGSGFTRGSLMMQAHEGFLPFSGNIIRSNIFFAKQPYQFLFHSYNPLNTANATTTFGVLDSNYWAKPINSGVTPFLVFDKSNGNDYRYFTLSGWQTFSSQDNNSILNPREINSTDSLRFEYNATDNPITVSLDQKYIDVKDIVYDGSIILQPWRSAVLIKDGPATDCCAGIEEEKTIAPISIFPNPVNDYFTVEGATQISSIKVIDLSGRTMKKFKPTSSNVYSISGLASGTYLVVITNGSSEVSKHIVKQ